jgi:hypothetical protein
MYTSFTASGILQICYLCKRSGAPEIRCALHRAIAVPKQKGRGNAQRLKSKALPPSLPLIHHFRCDLEIDMTLQAVELIILGIN